LAAVSSAEKKMFYCEAHPIFHLINFLPIKNNSRNRAHPHLRIRAFFSFYHSVLLPFFCDLSRPFRAYNFSYPDTQGFTLGFRIEPFQGKNSRTDNPAKREKEQ